ncbi:MAG: hypothetical protein K2N34_11805, partial [Lachnospiraceae bacterium]|nr:hypothetical protein [Lachnospiraceae bacterium]
MLKKIINKRIFCCVIGVMAAITGGMTGGIEGIVKFQSDVYAAEKKTYKEGTYAQAVNEVESYTELTVSGKSSASDINVNESVSLTGSASGGSGTYTYRFIEHNLVTNQWMILRDFGKSSTYTWKSASDGNREFYIEVKDGNGTVKRTEAISVKVGNAERPLSITPIASVTSAIVGTKITFTAIADGGSGSYTYSYIMHNKDTGDWYRFSDFQSSNTLIWEAMSVGNREFFAEVKDSMGKVVRSTAVNVSVTKAKALSVEGTASVTSADVGTNVTFMATAEGGSGSYTYSYIIHNKDTGAWYISDFQSSNTFTWEAVSAGNREFFVEVKDSTGKVARSAAMNVSVTQVKALSVTGTASVQTARVGAKITFTAIAEGGRGSYTYCYLMHNKDTDSWFRFSDFQSENTFTWEAGSAGNREFFVEVRDGTGKIVRS